MAQKRFAFVIETERCIDCKACMVSCSIENNVPVGHHRNWVHQIGIKGEFPTLGMSFEPGNCMHCDNPPCERVCPVGATYRRDDGIVMIDQDACIGCKYCIEACPYDARYFNEETGTTDKCTACVHLVYKGEDPACVATCIGNARHFGDINDPESEVSQLLATNDYYRLYEEAGTGPAIYYIYKGGRKA